MPTKVREMQDTKTAMLEAGIDLMSVKGYSNTGIQDIIQAVSIPKGCFYHYFPSKESFAISVIRHFDSNYSAASLDAFNNLQRRPIERLRDYCQTAKGNLLNQDCRRGCLISNLCQEMSDQNENLRLELVKVEDNWRETVSQCIEEGQKLGEINATRFASDLAELFLSAWSGCYSRAKSVRTPKALDLFIDLIFEEILKPRST